MEDVNPAPADNSYAGFCAMMTGYRQLAVVMAAVDCGIIDVLSDSSCTLERLLETAGVKAPEGERFVRLLVSSDILQERDGLFHLSPFSATYLHRESEFCQRGVMEFERQLQRRWEGLGGQLQAGQGSVVEEPAPHEYQRRLGLFHRAMHEAAVVRSAELWDAVGTLSATGFIIDAGAGDGTYLRSFLGRHPAWRALACDLGDVLSEVTEPGDGVVSLCPCNLLDSGERREFVGRYRGTADLLLLSNFIHCYSRDEVAAMLADLAELVARDGRLVIHDFFTDGNRFGALYDLHMLVNTYNGRTYTFAETDEVLALSGFSVCRTLALPSFSHALVARRE
ncbi:MAG TPA: methyltransferase [Geobacteraceae bacterium]|nr:methyltransferase [Geobacteraceae bacterium]